MAAFLDQAGAPFSVWEPGTMPGAEVFDEPGALTWNELTTRDVEGSKAFYGAVFGWTARESSMAGVPYVVWECNGETIAGMQPMVGGDWPDDLPPHWMIYFAVRDCDESAGYARELGGRDRAPADQLPDGPVRRPRGPAGRHVLDPRQRARLTADGNDERALLAVDDLDAYAVVGRQQFLGEHLRGCRTRPPGRRRAGPSGRRTRPRWTDRASSPARSGPLAPQPVDQLEDLLLVADVEGAGRLVEQQDPGALREGPGQEHPLTFATGQGVEPPAGEAARSSEPRTSSTADRSDADSRPSGGMYGVRPSST